MGSEGGDKVGEKYYGQSQGLKPFQGFPHLFPG